jgi:uncharacterized protein
MPDHFPDPGACGVNGCDIHRSGFSISGSATTLISNTAHSIFREDTLMDPLKIPRMTKAEYDALIERQYVSRIAFIGNGHPYIAPFMYVFDKKYLYFLSSRYGRKMEYFASNPRVSVEIEEYAPDLSSFTFVSLQGMLEEVRDPAQKTSIREQFVAMIRKRRLSSKVLAAFGYSPRDPVEEIVRSERSAVWKLVGVKDIVALKNG